MKAPNTYCLLALLTICFCWPNAAGQTANRSIATLNTETKTEDEELVRTLVEEVRQLRLTLQRTTVGAYRFQLAFERLRLQQGRVDSLTRQMESLHLQLDSTKFARTQFEARAKDTQEQLDHEQDAKRRAVLEQQLKEYKRILGTQTQQEQRQRDREIVLTGQLQAEQLKLSDLNNQLDNLERELMSLSNAKEDE